MAPPASFEEFPSRGQKNIKTLGFNWEAPFPLALKAVSTNHPTPAPSKELSISGQLLELANKHGGTILIRGLPIENPQDYSELAHAFGFQAHEEVGRPLMRTALVKNIKTTNRRPPELPVQPHNEYGWSTINPAWLTFSALALSDEGGETLITFSIALAAEIKRQAPQFYEKLLRNGVRCVRRYGKTYVQSNTRTSVFGAYGQHVLPTDDERATKEKFEVEVRMHSNNFVWNTDGSLFVSYTVPLIRIHQATGLPSWFGNVTGVWGRRKHHGATEPPFRGDDDSYHPSPEYGNGEQIEKAFLDLALSLAESSQVLVQ